MDNRHCLYLAGQYLPICISLHMDHLPHFGHFKTPLQVANRQFNSSSVVGVVFHREVKPVLVTNAICIVAQIKVVIVVRHAKDKP